MSHFTVLVIGENHDAQLAPFQENNMGDCPREYMEFTDMEDEYLERYKNDGMTKYATFDEFVKDCYGCKERDKEKNRYGYWENPNRKWDGYQVGGRWSGFLKLKAGAEGAHGERSWMRRGEPTEFGRCDQAKKGDIDFAGMRDEEGQEAAKNWDLFHKHLGHLIEGFVNRDDMRKRHKSNIGAARYEYHNQPLCLERGRLLDRENGLKGDDRDFFARLEIDEYLVSRDEFIQHARDTAIVTFALLKDGKWYEKGKMGWWGIVHNEKDQSVWNRQFNELLDGLPEDTLLTVVDCHI